MRTFTEHVNSQRKLYEESKKQEEYQKFFNAMLDKYDVKSPAELSDEDKTKFFSEIKDTYKDGKGKVEDIKESINDSKLNEEKISEEVQLSHLKIIQDALPELESLMNKRLKSNIKFGLTAEIEQGRFEDIIRISGVDLAKTLKGTIASAIFSEININFWGGVLTTDGNTYWFNPKVSYNHPSGGSNGTDFIWDTLWFDLNTGNWVEGDVKL